jgi:hypothetical protein
MTTFTIPETPEDLAKLLTDESGHLLYYGPIRAGETKASASILNLCIPYWFDDFPVGTKLSTSKLRISIDAPEIRVIKGRTTNHYWFPQLKQLLHDTAIDIVDMKKDVRCDHATYDKFVSFWTALRKLIIEREQLSPMCFVSSRCEGGKYFIETPETPSYALLVHMNPSLAFLYR